MERTRLESAATDYTYLRGLFGIPIGLTFILAALGNVGWGPLDHAWVFLVCLAALGLVVPADQPLLRPALRPGDAHDAPAGARDASRPSRARR